MKYKFDLTDIKDIMIVNTKGQLQYFNIGSLEFFDLKPEEILDKTMPELYENLDQDTSTFEIAVRQKKETLGAVQVLMTQGGKVVRQTSDTLLLRDGERVLGAVEFTYAYDEEKDVLGICEKRQKEYPQEKEVVSISDMIGECPEMRRLKRKAAKAADSAVPILIAGETGTGKERMARAIHYSGKRKKEPFVYLNCNSIPEDLLEGILFGTAKGSFTDAQEREGLFQMADGGTLLLDEIDTMTLAVQGKLLKAIEDGRVRSIGGKEEYHFDLRIIACCNCGLKEIMNSRHLRQDLYFRLAVLQMELPPLRQRGQDVLQIAEYYIGEYNKATGRKLKGFTPAAAAYLEKYAWEGNVRELRNLIERLYFDHEEEEWISLETVKEKLREKDSGSQEKQEEEYERYLASGSTLADYMAAREKELAAKALADSQGNMTQAARMLRVTPKTLRTRLKTEKTGK